LLLVDSCIVENNVVWFFHSGHGRCDRDFNYIRIIIFKNEHQSSVDACVIFSEKMLAARHEVLAGWYRILANTCSTKQPNYDDFTHAQGISFLRNRNGQAMGSLPSL